ncbi:type II toxin-antitoxin system PemK/MazF family toxin [bacterium AH-315-P15]|nr:type II toxin-antitoxin system PemK/MazF family toxin [bacterium AH-315-P15]
MPISEHPKAGTVLLCDFNNGFKVPEMTKIRPVVVLSPKIVARPFLCTIVSLSTDTPDPVMQYHRQIDIRPKLPDRYDSDGVWVKGDMIYAVGFHRLDFIRCGKDRSGKRLYHYDPVSDQNLKIIRQCVLRGMGLQTLTKHL